MLGEFERAAEEGDWTWWSGFGMRTEIWKREKKEKKKREERLVLVGCGVRRDRVEEKVGTAGGLTRSSGE